jgi:hypothetical protein
MSAERIWPGGAPYALCLSHDVDRVKKQLYHYVFYAAKGGFRGLSIQAASLYKRMRGEEPYWNFERIMELEDRLGVRSTFLFLIETAHGFSPKYWGRYDINRDEVKSVIRTLDRGGWEIGLHGSSPSMGKGDPGEDSGKSSPECPAALPESRRVAYLAASTADRP